MHGDSDCVFTRMNYIMKDETCFRFITSSVHKSWYNVLVQCCVYECWYVPYKAVL